MQLELSQKEISHLLYLTNTIVQRRNTMPILANVKLSTEEGILCVTATDMAVSLVGEMDADVKTPGTITVDAKFIYEIVKELPGETVRLNTTIDQRLEIESGKSRFKINGVSSSEYPTVAGVTLANPIAIDSSRLREMLDRTMYAISQDETRFNINGVYVELVDDEINAGSKNLRFVATDGHRLACIDRPADGLEELDAGVILPKKGISELRKVIEDNDGVAYVGVHEGFFTVESERVKIGVRLADGVFPHYRQVIPEEHNTIVRVQRSELLSVVKRIALVTADKERSVVIKVLDNNLYISSSSPEYGEAVESLTVEQDGENVSVSFSAKYIIDLLSAMSDSDMITLSLNGETGPGLFVGDNDDSYLCVVMPMRFE